jgi:hypothetical protein
MTLLVCSSLPLAGIALAQAPKPAPPAQPAPAQPPAPGAAPEGKPDCSSQKTAYDEAVTASKAKPDLSSCKDMKGQEKKDCEKPIKDKAKEDATAAKEKVAEAKKALDCCKNPKKKGCM